MSGVEAPLRTGRRGGDLPERYGPGVRRLPSHAAALALAVAVLALAACGPTGPNEPGGAAADPVALLTVLPVPAGLQDAQPATDLPPEQVLEAMVGSSSAERGRRLVDAGMTASAVRVFTTPNGGRMWAVVTVWPSKLVAGNLALQVAQERLGDAGVRAWTPDGVPGSQGIRETGGDRERVAARAVGPNAIVVRATGDVPDDGVARTLRRLVVVQEAAGDG